MTQVKVGHVYQDMAPRNQAKPGHDGRPTKTPNGPRYLEVVRVFPGLEAALMRNQSTRRRTGIRLDRLLSGRYQRANRVTLTVHCDGDAADEIVAAIMRIDRLADTVQS